MFRIPVLAVAVGLATTVAACAQGSQPDTGTRFDAVPHAQLVAAADQEGSLTWYTTFAADDVQPIVAAFNKQYPKVKVNSLRLSADKIAPRVFIEQRGGKYNADVVSGDSPQIAQLEEVGALQPYRPADLPPLPPGLNLPEGFAGVIYVGTTVIAYNPTVLHQRGIAAPNTWQDLTQPIWRGQFSIDPGAVNWYDSLIKTMGRAKALALVTALGRNSPVFVESHTQAVTEVQAGEPMAAATTYGYKAASIKKKTPASVEYVNPAPLPASLNLIDLVKDGPHPAAARLFEDWIVSQQGQSAIVAITNHTSVRNDVDNDPKVWNETKWPVAWGDPNLSSTAYNSELSEMKAALRAP